MTEKGDTCAQNGDTNGQNGVQSTFKVSDCDSVPKGQYKIVMYDFETTGKSLQDEICHIGCFAPLVDNKKDEVAPDKHHVNGNGTEEKEKGDDGEEEEEEKIGATYSQYIMPHRNVSFSSRNAFGLTVVSLDYQRMLRDVNTGKLLKTKSEISALKDWMKWLEEIKEDADGIILVHHAHDQARDVHVGLLLLALTRYNLVQQFSNIVKGFCNSVNVISDLGDKSVITSLSLRSLCKTVLKDPHLSTTLAVERCTRMYQIVSEIISETSSGQAVLVGWLLQQALSSKIHQYAHNPSSEQAKLARLQSIQSAQYSMRPIFSSYFSSGYKIRTRMLAIRRAIAEAGLDYGKLTELAADDKLINKLENIKLEDDENIKLMIDTVNSHFQEKDDIEEGGDVGVSPPAAVVQVSVKCQDDGAPTPPTSS